MYKKRGSHHQKLPSHREIQRLHDREIFQVLPGDQGNRDIVNIDLLFSNQVKQEVHGPGKGFKLDLIGLIVIKIGKIGEIKGRGRIQSQAFLQEPR